MIYLPAFDATTISGTITLTRGGESDKTVTISSFSDNDANGDASTLYCHYPVALGGISGQDPDGTGFLDTYSATAFGQALLNAIEDTPTWADNAFAVTWDPTGGLYAITDLNTTTFAITFSNSTVRNLLGYSGNQSGAAAYTSDQTPYYTVLPTLSAVSEPRTNYEPPGIAVSTVSDQGHVFGTSRGAAPLYRDWVQQFETKAKTLRLSATSTNPFTIQHFFEHTRKGYAYVVVDGFGDSQDHMFNLRSDGTSFVPEPASPGDDTQFHVPFRSHVVGINATVSQTSFT